MWLISAIIGADPRRWEVRGEWRRTWRRPDKPVNVGGGNRPDWPRVPRAASHGAGVSDRIGATQAGAAVFAPTPCYLF